MNTVEDKIRAATRAEAATLRELRPLRLPPASGELPGMGAAARARRARRFRTWIAPVTAAAAVIALAISLVIVRDIPNARVAPPAGPLPAAAGVPQYYATLYTPPQPASAPPLVPCAAGTPPTKCPASATDLIVGDTFTGARLAVLAPPAGSYFSGVVAAADDRTFVVDTTALTVAGARTWYLLRISPGAGSAAGRSAASITRLTKLPIPALTAYISAIALSGSGRELAVALGQSATSELRIYSVATGRLLRAWSTKDPNAFGLDSYYAQQSRALAWIDGDRQVAFFSTWLAGITTHMAWRELDIATGGGDLMADSKVIWSSTSTVADEFSSSYGWIQAVSPDGKTVMYSSVSIARGTVHKPLSWRLAWLAYSVPAGTVRTLYEVTVNGSAEPFFYGLWTSASGGTSIAEWGTETNDPKSERFGVLSRGAFRQLPSPPQSGSGAPSVTW